MPIMTAIVLSGSTNGKAIPIVSTSSPGDTLHTVSSATTSVVEDVYIDIKSQATTDRVFTLENGGTASTARAEFLVPAQSAVRVAAGDRYTSATGIIIRGFATATGGLVACGAVNRATP